LLPSAVHLPPLDCAVMAQNAEKVGGLCNPQRCMDIFVNRIWISFVPRALVGPMVVALGACAHVDVQDMGNGQHSLTTISSSGGFSGSREEAIERANDWCAKSGAQAVIGASTTRRPSDSMASTAAASSSAAPRPDRRASETGTLVEARGETVPLTFIVQERRRALGGLCQAAHAQGCARSSNHSASGTPEVFHVDL
jgi:hypothetical protein